MYELLKKDGAAKRGRFHTVHGVIETPVFMNVGTAAAIKGAVSTDDLRGIGTQVELSNTYHLHVRPGDEIVKKLGGLHRFMNWDRPILTDSGGFQVFSLASLRKIKEEGVHFHSHVDGRKIFMGPEESMQIQSNLASTIAMAFDECPPSTADRKYIEHSVARTTRWLKRCKDEMARLNSLPDTINPHQMLFGINQGGVCEDIRIAHAQQIRELDLDGYAIERATENATASFCLVTEEQLLSLGRKEGGYPWDYEGLPETPRPAGTGDNGEAQFMFSFGGVDVEYVETDDGDDLVYRMTTTVPGPRTLGGIQVGDSEDDVKAVYTGAVQMEAVGEDQFGADYALIHEPGGLSYCKHISFFITDGEVSAIQVEDLVDGRLLS